MPKVSTDKMRRVADSGAADAAAAIAAGGGKPRVSSGKAEAVDFSTSASRSSASSDEDIGVVNVSLMDRVVTQDPIKSSWVPLLGRRKSDLEKQYVALNEMRNCAAGPGVSQAEGQKFFDLQYGKTDQERLSHFKAEFGGRWPANVQKDKNIEQAFVTTKFIELFKTFTATQDITTIEVRDEPTLFRIPASIQLCKELTDINFHNCNLQSVADPLLTLSKLEHLNLSRNPLRGNFLANWKGLVRLKTINLSHCEIVMLYIKCNSESLRVVDVRYNGLRFLPQLYNSKRYCGWDYTPPGMIIEWWDGNHTLLNQLLKKS